MIINEQRGIIFYIALMIMTILLAIGFGLTTIFLGQLEIMKGMGNSVVAFHAANAGIERVLVDRAAPPATTIGFLDLDNDGIQDPEEPTYKVTAIVGGVAGCLGVPNFCIKSAGSYRGVRRAIEIRY